ncbi:MAG: ferric reductase-like transmembrane domain-containing protein [Deltaproteobacteria bacterium]|nr:ferric reductase-like transmembrane domain-containing protein [Deltaproteobacteria bacterium]MBW2068598.1 ferric reductase-like transmembrane domain-containing protein [Deltaproteobacteria bacterium]
MGKRGLLGIIWYIVGIVLLVLIIATWVFYAGGLLWFKLNTYRKIGTIGSLFGYISLYLFVLTTFVAVRLSLLERAYGLNNLIRFHRKVGPFVVICVIVHAILKIWAYSLSTGETWSWDFAFQFFPYTWDLKENAFILARWALLIMITSVAVAQVGRIILPFRFWKSLHLAMYWVVAAGFLHAIAVSSTIQTFPVLGMWAILAALWTSAAGYRLNYLKVRTKNQRWILESVQYETYDTHTCRFIRRGDPGSFSSWAPGQFALFRMKSKLWGWSEPHPFTLSCIPGEGVICCTVKGVGNFSKRLRTAHPGTEFLCEGPYGVFTPDFTKEKKLVFIAGGIGVTPFLSMIRYAVHNNLPVTIDLIWGNKAKRDIIAYSELSRYVKKFPGLRVVHVLSEQKITEKLLEETSSDGFFWEQGFVSGAILKKYVDPDGASFYLCGPAPMQRFVLKELNEVFGVSRRRVKRELFLLF